MTADEFRACLLLLGWHSITPDFFYSPDHMMLQESGLPRVMRIHHESRCHPVGEFLPDHASFEWGVNWLHKTHEANQ